MQGAARWYVTKGEKKLLTKRRKSTIKGELSQRRKLMQKKLVWITLFLGFFLIGYLLVKDTSGASSAKLSSVPAQHNMDVPVGGLSEN